MKYPHCNCNCNTVTFSLSLRVTEILRFCAALFSSPPQSLQIFSHVPLGVGGWPLGYEEQRCCANCPSISFQDFQPTVCDRVS